MPTIAAFSESSTEGKKYSFILANPFSIVATEDAAVLQATIDFSEACRVDDATGSIEAMGLQLAVLGYDFVENFRVVDSDT